jgi:hypothetical protein
MDPATIGLLISIAPTVLELLFGRGQSDIKQEMFPKKMYGYGYGLEGYGYRYPPIEGYYEEPIVVGTVEKEGPFKGFPIYRYAPKVNEKWVAVYELNKRIADRNPWLAKAKAALQQASQEYLEELKTKNPAAYAQAMKAKQKRLENKKKGPLALRVKAAQEMYERLHKLPDEELLKYYYSGRRVPKTKKKKTVLVEVPAEQVVAKK